MERVKVMTSREFTPEEESARDDEVATAAKDIACEEAQSRVKAHCLSLVAGDFGGVESFKGLQALETIWQSVAPAARSDALKLAEQRRQYAKAKLQEIEGFDKATAEAYDPSTDAGWP